METKEKRNTGLVVVIILLVVALLGSVGYTVYDKVLSKDKDTEIKKSNEKYLENFISNDYISKILNSLNKGENTFNEEKIVKSLYIYMQYSPSAVDIQYSLLSNRIEEFFTKDLNISPDITEKMKVPENFAKENDNSTIKYISKTTINEITKKVFNVDFSKIETKFEEFLKNAEDSIVFGEYNDGYLFLFASHGGLGYFYELKNITNNNDTKIYNYDVYCSTPASNSDSFVNTKIATITLNSKYNKNTKSFVFSDYEYNFDESIDTSKCYLP